MTIVVENGTCVAGANSPVSAADADTFFSAQGNLDWDAAADKEAALIQATVYIDARFREMWKGKRTFGRAQALAWPRTGVSDEDNTAVGKNEMPVEYKQAVIIAGLVASQGNLDVTQDPDVFITSEQIGPIKMTYAKDDTMETGNAGVGFHDFLDQLLVGLLQLGLGSTIFLQRV
jgi:hypothetical protein